MASRKLIDGCCSAQGWSRGHLAFCLALACLAGCTKQQLYSNLAERDANEMMAILARSGIACDKTAAQEEGQWNLSVSASAFAQAVETLNGMGYPKDQYADMGQVFQKSGLVSSPSEERIRFVHALSQEVAHTLSMIDGVLTARVQIVLPSNNPFGEATTPSSAAVFIKHRPDSDVESSVVKIKELVIASIEGLGPENVTVALFPAEDLSPAGTNGGAAPELASALSLQLAPASVTPFWTLVGGLTATALLGWIFGLAVWLRGRPAVRAGAAA
jgi:type III secretion protein J